MIIISFSISFTIIINRFSLVEIMVQLFCCLKRICILGNTNFLFSEAKTFCFWKRKPFILEIVIRMSLRLSLQSPKRPILEHSKNYELLLFLLFCLKSSFFKVRFLAIFSTKLTNGLKYAEFSSFRITNYGSVIYVNFGILQFMKSPTTTKKIGVKAGLLGCPRPTFTLFLSNLNTVTE